MKITRKAIPLLGVVTFSIILGACLTPQTEAQTSNNTNQSWMRKTNFADQISQQFHDSTFLVDIIYESPTTLILQGPNIKTKSAFNDVFWRAVDFLKDKGFTIDKIDLKIGDVLPFVEGEQVYEIYMSRGVSK